MMHRDQLRVQSANRRKVPILLQGLKPKQDTIVPYRQQRMSTLEKNSQMGRSYKIVDVAEDPNAPTNIQSNMSIKMPLESKRSTYMETSGRMKKNHTFRMQSAQRRLDEENRKLLYRLMFTNPSYPRADW